MLLWPRVHALPMVQGLQVKGGSEALSSTRDFHRGHYLPIRKKNLLTSLEFY